MVGQMNSTIGEEKKHNPRLTKSREEFVQIMADLKLCYPKQIGKMSVARTREARRAWHSFRQSGAGEYDLWNL